jgi:hypothetical protein
MYKAKSAWMLRDGKGKNAISMVLVIAQVLGKVPTNLWQNGYVAVVQYPY